MEVPNFLTASNPRNPAPSFSRACLLGIVRFAGLPFRCHQRPRRARHDAEARPERNPVGVAVGRGEVPVSSRRRSGVIRFIYEVVESIPTVSPDNAADADVGVLGTTVPDVHPWRMALSRSCRRRTSASVPLRSLDIMPEAGAR